MVVTEKIVENLVSKLFELLQKEYGLQKGVRDKIKGLSRELGSVRAVLSKIGGVPSDQLDEQVRLWVCDIREASYDMEDILDAFLVDHVRRPDEPADKNLLKRLLKKLGKLFQKSKDHRKFSTLIEDISKKLEEVAARRGRYTVDTIVARPAAATTIDPRLLHLYKRASELVGIEKPRDELINKLSLGHDDDGGSDKKMKIVSVFGFGGLGKTTLAKAVYDHFKQHFKCRPSVQVQVDQDPDMNDQGIDDQLLKPHFECGAFVPVGRNPNIKKVFRDILVDLDKQKYTNLNMKEWDEKQLMDELNAFIKEKRFFIVIDDIWDKESWKLIRCALQESHYESRLVITTRLFEVATYAGEVYKIKPLSHDNSEKLLYARIADSEGKYFYNPSAEACDKILKKCGGVPLSIITIASLLASKPDEEWSEVYNSIGFGHEDNDDVDNTRRILAFSYYDLPPHLKPCLLYLSIFPEDDVIEKNSLIWKWAAEGFIVIPEEQAAAGVGLFELGERYFNELINRSMIMPKESHDGYIDGCSVHDMVLDFIHSLPSNEAVITVLEGDEQQVLPGSIARRLALRSVGVHNGCQLANIAVEKVRSLIASQCIFYESWPRLPILRVLDMVNCAFKYFFDEGVEEDCNEGTVHSPTSLRHLRYLRLEGTYTPELTRDIRYLKFLQTLDLWGFDLDNNELPEEVGLLTQLVCLRVQPYTTVPTGVISKLSSLQELWIKYNSKSYDYDDDAMLHLVKELGLLRELRVLRTEIILGSESTAIALQESLGNLHSIRELLIEGLRMLDYNGETSDAGSVSYRHLRVLRLHCFSELPAWIKSSLAPNLSYLKVHVKVVKEQDMENLARLPELRCLMLKLDLCEPEERDHKLVISIKIHVGYFRKLRILRIAGMSIWFDLLDSECNSSGSSRASSNNIMPSLESLEFDVDVRSLKAATQFGFHKLIGFDNLGRTSLQSVTTTVNCGGARASEVEEVEAALLTAAAAHPKHPTFQARWQEENLISLYQEACMDVSRNPEVVNKAWKKLVNIISSGYIRALSVPDPAASSSKVIHLLYTNNGIALLALCSNAVHKLWKWKRSDKNPRGKSTTSDPPQLWQPAGGILIKNDTANVNPKESTSCIALSKNDSYLISASGGSVSLFNIMTFMVMTTFMEPPPAATFVAFYPQDNNIIAIGMEDSSIQIYNVRTDEVKTVLRGHQKRITGLTFSQSKDVLVSSDADAKLCVWSMEDDGWEKKNSTYIQHPANSSGRLVGDTTVQFHYDQMHILAVHGTQLVIFDWKLECLCSWSPRDTLPALITCGVYSSDGFLVYAGFCDGAIGIFEARSLTLHCRIAPSAYITSPVSSDGRTVYPMVVAANPWKPNQMAVGMSDGAVHVLEPPLDTDV